MRFSKPYLVGVKRALDMKRKVVDEKEKEYWYCDYFWNSYATKKNILVDKIPKVAH